jgi:hypothetical protein
MQPNWKGNVGRIMSTARTQSPNHPMATTKPTDRSHGERSRVGSASGLPQEGGVGDHGGHDVGVHVGRRPAVLKVALAVLLRLAADTDRRATVGDTLQSKDSFSETTPATRHGFR